MTQNDLMIRKNRVKIKNYERIFQQKLRAKKKELNARKKGRISYREGMDFTQVKTEDLITEGSDKKSLNSEILIMKELQGESQAAANEGAVKKMDTLEVPEG